MLPDLLIRISHAHFASVSRACAACTSFWSTLALFRCRCASTSAFCVFSCCCASSSFAPAISSFTLFSAFAFYCARAFLAFDSTSFTRFPAFAFSCTKAPKRPTSSPSSDCSSPSVAAPEPAWHWTSPSSVAILWRQGQPPRFLVAYGPRHAPSFGPSA